jgi:hypothetical protein
MSRMAGSSCHYSYLTSSDPTVDVDGIIVTDEWHGDYYQFNQELDTQPMHTHTHWIATGCKQCTGMTKPKRRNLKMEDLCFFTLDPLFFPIWTSSGHFCFSDDLALAFLARTRETPMSSCCSSSSRSGTVNTDRFSPSMCLCEFCK